MGECYWCLQPHCDPWGSCQEPDPSELEEITLFSGGANNG